MPFKTAWLFRNPHFQTIWPALFRFPPTPGYTRERIELHDSDFIDIDWCGNNNPDTAIVLLFHGLEGSSHSRYVIGMVNILVKQGLRCAAINFRGCSGEMNRLARSYHSGATDDVNEIINILRKRYPDSSLHAIGYSLGGNVMLKWCAEKGIQNSLKSVVAVSVPYRLDVASNTLDSNTFFSSLYRWRLLKSLMSKALAKAEKGIIKHDPAEIKKIKTFYDFDDQLTAPLHGYEGADDYYSRASSHPHLNKIKIPTLLLHATDDPFMDNRAIPVIAETSAQVTLELSQYGGHVGFYNPSLNNTSYWLEPRIIDFLKTNMGNSNGLQRVKENNR